MRITSRDLSPRLMFALLAAWFFIAPGGQAVAQTRSFQMATWAKSDGSASVDSDIPVFFDTVGQPEGRSILIWTEVDKPISASSYAWSRIVAVLFDEPYRDMEFRCVGEHDREMVEERAQLLAQRAAELKALSPSTRFWVNLTENQARWPTDTCVDEGWADVDVNRPYIDVISLDIYHEPFAPRIKDYYDQWLASPAKPEQQVALIPGTFFRLNRDNPATHAAFLEGYFNYANESNQNCNLPYGERGVTGSFDGCRVWMVMGWLSDNYYEYIGMSDQRSELIAVAWREQRDFPLDPDLANQVPPADLVPALVTPVLN